MNEETKIRVMIVDDHAVVRSGLGAFLSVIPDLELVGEAENGDLAVVRCGHLHPDVILMDLMMPGTDGVTATRLIREKYPQTQVIALTSFQEDELVQNAMKCRGDRLFNEECFCAGTGRSHPRRPNGQDDPLPGSSAGAGTCRSDRSTKPKTLTEREQDVLRLMVDGLNNARNRRAFGGQPFNGQIPYQQHPDEAGRGKPCRGGHDCDAEEAGVDALP